MHFLDVAVLALYFAGMLAVGVYFNRRQTGLEEYFVGGRNVSARHIGLSVVATDVGGGFSILLAYSFMVAGLLVPTLAALFWRRPSGTAAFASIMVGGGSTVILNVIDTGLGIDPVFVGLGLSTAVLVVLGPAGPRAEGALQ